MVIIHNGQILGDVHKYIMFPNLISTHGCID